MIPLYAYAQFPAQKQQQTGSDGSLRPPFYYLIYQLFRRTGSNSGIPQTVGAGLVAAGAGQASALPFTEDFNEILSGAGGGMLAALQPGQWQVVFNGTGGSINVYPQVGGQIDALGANTAYALAPGKTQVFWAASILASGVAQYRSLQLG